MKGEIKMAYKWDNAYEWLVDKAKSVNDIVELKSILFKLIPKIPDSDTIQNLFENEMDEDGYFDEMGR